MKGKINLGYRDRIHVDGEKSILIATCPMKIGMDWEKQGGKEYRGQTEGLHVEGGKLILWL